MSAFGGKADIAGSKQHRALVRPLKNELGTLVTNIFGDFFGFTGIFCP
jgi:hypothetical protein